MLREGGLFHCKRKRPHQRSFSVSAAQRVSRDTSRASARSIAVETLQSPRFSISSIVRTGTLLNRLRAGTGRPFSSRMVLSFIKMPPYFFLSTVMNAAIEISSATILMPVDNSCIIF